MQLNSSSVLSEPWVGISEEKIESVETMWSIGVSEVQIIMCSWMKIENREKSLNE